MSIARLLILGGMMMIVSGAILLFFPGLFKWFGQLPGDIRIERENGSVFIPLGSMIIISVLLTLIVNIAGWLFSFFSRFK
jgi:hypothetical protein